MPLPEWWGSDKPYKVVDAYTGLKALPDGVIDIVITGPPAYEPEGDRKVWPVIGFEQGPDGYRMAMEQIADQLFRVVKHRGTVWVTTETRRLKTGRVLDIPALMVTAFERAGWVWFEDIIESKLPLFWTTGVPERPNNLFIKLHTNVLVFAKSEAAIVRPMNYTTIWETKEHVRNAAGYESNARETVIRAIHAAAPQGGIVLDPFCGMGTTLAIAEEHGRVGLGFDINPACAALIDHELGLDVVKPKPEELIHPPDVAP
jgi:site-specific DNA-methyltransferase (adenine-specific)